MTEILIVDDHEPVIASLTKRLETENMEAEGVLNGEQALYRLCQRTIDDNLYDAIILDIKMPVVDGWQVLRAIKRNPLWEAIQVIVLTGTAESAEDVRTVIDYDGVFISKKAGSEEIVTLLLDRILPETRTTDAHDTDNNAASS